MNQFSLQQLPHGSNIHFIGVGGVSMSGLAEILLSRGYCVSGSDIRHSEVIKKLENLGLNFHLGHHPENVNGAGLVVYTAAVSADNPELVSAGRQNILTIPRSALLGAIMSHFKHSIAIAGTHGKTTVTSMLSYICRDLDLDPTILVGARLDLIDGNVKTGKSDYMIAEACEYHRSFLDFRPFCATILNVEPDHLDYYKDAADYHSAYADFLQLVSPQGFVVACADDADLMALVKQAPCPVTTYALENSDADFTAKDIATDRNGTNYLLYKGNKKICAVKLRVFGAHNILNSMAALVNAYLFEMDMSKAAEALQKFRGADRRFEWKGTFHGADVYDDYAHHPTEIRATLEAARRIPHKRVVCVFQPHTYSRTKAFFEEFSRAFNGVDLLILADIYAAREKSDGSVSSVMLQKEIEKQRIPCLYFDSFEKIAQKLRQEAREGDILIIMGAGDIVGVTPMLLS